MNTLDSSAQTVESGKWKVLLRVAAIGGALVTGPAAWSFLTPIVLPLLQILLGLGQMCVTFLRING
ncbi:MAG TPA: hypothetical protein VGF20_05260 [Candidatus Acidoferrum sp.]|jgi:hypothetical protein